MVNWMKKPLESGNVRRFHIHFDRYKFYSLIKSLRSAISFYDIGSSFRLLHTIRFISWCWHHPNGMTQKNNEILLMLFFSLNCRCVYSFLIKCYKMCERFSKGIDGEISFYCRQIRSSIHSFFFWIHHFTAHWSNFLFIVQCISISISIVMWKENEWPFEWWFGLLFITAL